MIALFVLLTGCSPFSSDTEDATPQVPISTNTVEPASITTESSTIPEATSAPTQTSLPPATVTPTSVPDSTSTPPPPESTPTESSPAPPSASDVWNLSQFEIDDPVMVLTFDAGADRGHAGEILDILAEEGVQASFGMTGPWAEENPDLLLRMVNEGHHLINHSWSHPHFPELTTEGRIAEVQGLEEFVRNQVGVELQPYFRPPFGEYDEATLADLAAMGYTVNVLWTVDTLGWNGLSVDEINVRVMEAAAPGGIVLMHVGAQSQDAAALPEMIRLLREQGYTFATIEQLVDR